jgi:DNA replication and repair protein RecF
VKIIKNISINNFRCFSHKELLFDQDICQLIGRNGTGKTSILEAIYALISCHSFREHKIVNLIKKNKDSFSLKGDILDSSYEISVDEENKKLYIDGIEQKKTLDYLGFCRSLIFYQKDIVYIDGGPLERRGFIDFHLMMANKDYVYILTRYKKILKFRNELLKTSTTLGSFSFQQISEELSSLCKEVVDSRKTFISKLNEIANRKFKEFSKGELSLEYSEEHDYEFINERLMSSYDYESRITSVGPHRDDIKILMDGYPASNYASLGFKYLIIIAINLAILEYIDTVMERETVVLIDDIFSIIDKGNRDILLNSLKDRQIIISSVDEVEMDRKYQVINVGEEDNE